MSGRLAREHAAEVFADEQAGHTDVAAEVVVVDGDDAYAGMTRLRAAKGADGARTFALANGLTAELAPVGEVMELRFSSGETLPMRRQPERAER